MDEKLKGIADDVRKRSEKLCTEVRGRARTTVDRIDTYAKSAIGRLSMQERLVLIFAIGIALGFVVKNYANQNVTIGYDDYIVKNQGKAYDLIAMQKQLAEKALSGDTTSSTPVGGSCQ
ncbi:MAG: hypothetical protein HGA31_05765 [Candidatus Moranbacteria bacterium]|nr:hypothetical protein [Candidatus Moranbacteria bacterium]